MASGPSSPPCLCSSGPPWEEKQSAHPSHPSFSLHLRRGRGEEKKSGRRYATQNAQTRLRNRSAPSQTTNVLPQNYSEQQQESESTKSRWSIYRHCSMAEISFLSLWNIYVANRHRFLGETWEKKIAQKQEKGGKGEERREVLWGAQAAPRVEITDDI